MRQLVIVLLIATPGRAADGLTPLADVPLPMPAPVVLPAEINGPVGFYRPNRLDVWQYYAVDRTGHFRPRVALRPEGTFYLYNGAPYYQLPVRERDVIAYLLD